MGLIDDRPHKWPIALHALEHLSFRLLWLATFVSNAGSWMQRVAASWLIYSISGSELWLGMDAAMAGLPALILLPFGGVLADRVDRRKVLLIANIVNALVALLLATLWWTGTLTAWQLLASSFMNGVIASIAAPASQSIIPSAAGEDHIPNAVALNSFQYNVARAIGPAAGGLVLAWWGAGWCFLLNSLSFLGMVGALIVIPVPRNATASRISTIESLRDGAAFLYNTASLRRMLVLVVLLAFGGAPLVTLLPAIAKMALSEGAAGYTTLLTAFGAGAAIAGVLLTVYRPERYALAWIVGAAITVGTCNIVMAGVTGLVLAASISGLAGMAFVGAMIELGTGLLSQTPDALRGRVSGVQQFCFRVAQPLGGLVAALVAHRAGIQTAFVTFGLLLIVGAVIMACLCSTRQST